MDCKQAQDWIRSERRFADGLTEVDQAALDAHLASCAACQAYQLRERAFDTAVRPEMLDVPIPPALSSRLQWALRRDRRAGQRARTLYAAAAAAALLFVGLGVGWYLHRPYDLASLYNSAEWLDSAQVTATYDMDQGPDGLKPWLGRNGVSTAVPQRLRLRHLAGAWIVKSGGRKVALLELREGTSLSRVFLLDSRYYSDALRRDLVASENVQSYVVADHPDSPSLGWMIVDQGTPQQFVDGEPQGGW